MVNVQSRSPLTRQMVIDSCTASTIKKDIKRSFECHTVLLQAKIDNVIRCQFNVKMFAY